MKSKTFRFTVLVLTLTLFSVGSLVGDSEVQKNGQSKDGLPEGVEGKGTIGKVVDENKETQGPVNVENKKDTPEKVNSWDWEDVESFNATIGLEQSSSSGADHKQRFFGSIYLSKPLPIPFLKDKAYTQLGSPLRIWGDIKFSSLPQQINSSLIQIPENFKKGLGDLEVNKIVRGFDFLTGIEWRIMKIRLEKSKIVTFNLTASWGATNPLSPFDSAQIYELNDEARKGLSEEYPDKKDEIMKKDKEYVAFVNKDRKRFFQQYYFGFRIKSYTKSKSNDEKGEFPGFFEFSLGKNDFTVPKFLNGGSYNRWVLRIGGFFPFKVGKFNIFVYGNAIVQLRKESPNDTTNPIVMNPKYDIIDFAGADSAKVVQLPIQIEARDFFRVGIGVDLTKIVNDLFPNKKPKEGNK